MDQAISEGHLVAFSPIQDIKKAKGSEAIPPKLFKVVRFTEWNGTEYIQFREPGKELDTKFFVKNYGVEILQISKLNLLQDHPETGRQPRLEP